MQRSVGMAGYVTCRGEREAGGKGGGRRRTEREREGGKEYRSALTLLVLLVSRAYNGTHGR
jgi:hypothetical protein